MHSRFDNLLEQTAAEHRHTRFRLWARITRGARRELLKHVLQFSSITHIDPSVTSMAR
jgi:hypothetical protein